MARALRSSVTPPDLSLIKHDDDGNVIYAIETTDAYGNAWSISTTVVELWGLLEQLKLERLDGRVINLPDFPELPKAGWIKGKNSGSVIEARCQAMQEVLDMLVPQLIGLALVRQVHACF